MEYWQGERDSLHVRGEDGEIPDFNPFSDFEVISDEENVARVQLRINMKLSAKWPHP